MENVKKYMLERFLKYVTFDTESCDDATVVPTTEGQFVFARYLEQQLKDMGLEDVVLDEKGYLYATLPANCDKDMPVVGFIAHLDTSPDMSGRDVKPRVVENYQGGDIVLDEKENIVLKVADFPEVENYKGDDVIVTDGHTLLGADDKAGVAEIVTAVAYLQAHPEIKHGKIRIAFNPDEEIGRGVTGLIPLTAAARANLSSRTSMQAAPCSQYRDVTCTRAMPKARCSTLCVLQQPLSRQYQLWSHPNAQRVMRDSII